MINLTINLKVTSRVGRKPNETFNGWHDMQRRDTAQLKTNGSETSTLLEKVGNITSNI